MNILIHSHLFPNAAKPAFGTFVYYFAEALSRLGHRVTVVSPVPYVPAGISRKHPWYAFKEVPFTTTEQGMEIYHPRFFSIPKRKLFFLRGDLMYYSARGFYHSLLRKKRFDIIHCHVALPDGVVGARLSKRFNIPYGLTIHGADIYESIPESRLNYIRIKNVIEGARFVGVVSTRLKTLLLNHCNLSETSRIQIVYNGIHFPETIPEIRWEDGKANAIRLLSVGHAIRRKGIGYVLKALSGLRKKHPHVVYYVVGDGVDLQYFRSVAREQKVDDITYFLGAQPNDRVFGYMKACDIFVLPSWDEAFGIVFIEAMYLQKIVIGCFGEGIEDVVKDGENGFLVTPRNEHALQKKLEYIIENLQSMAPLCEKARASVWPRFSWQRNAQEYLDIYRRALTEMDA